MANVPTNTEPCDDQENSDECIIRLRGLPFTVTADDIQSFLGDCQIKDGENGIHLTLSSLGRPSGEAYVELASPEDTLKALKKNREHMGYRYIEVFQATRSEMDWVVSHSGADIDSVMDEGCIRMRGLPYGSTKDHVESFFSGLLIKPDGIYLATDNHGQPTGEAYVQFVNKENFEKALQKHMEKIGHRYIEIFRSSLAEIKAQTGPRMRTSVSGFGRPTPYSRSERVGGPNRLRGLGGRPFSRFPRFQNNDYWEDSDNSGYWGCDGGYEFGPRNRPPMRGGFRGAGCSGFGLHRVHMRGLPYAATEEDVAMFFRPLRAVEITNMYDEYRSTGRATVTFASHDEAVEAMEKHTLNMGNRYIELELDSVPNEQCNVFGLDSSLQCPPYSSECAVGEFGGGKMGRRARGRGRGFGYNRRAGQDSSRFLPFAAEATMAEFGGRKMGSRARSRSRGFGYNNRSGQGTKPFMSSRGTRFG